MTAGAMTAGLYSKAERKGFPCPHGPVAGVGRAVAGLRLAAGLCSAVLCAGAFAITMMSQPAQAQSDRAASAGSRAAAAKTAKPVTPDDPFSTLFRGPKFTTTPADPPDWVKQSRPSEEQPFIPTGRARPEPPRPAMTPDRVRQVERELDALRARHDQMGRRRPAKVAGGSVAGNGKGKKGRKKKTAKPCVLTCASTIGNFRRR